MRKDLEIYPPYMILKREFETGLWYQTVYMLHAKYVLLTPTLNLKYFRTDIALVM